jgi:sugar lactone lactonase YvrE
MRRFFLGSALVTLCALPFTLESVEAGADDAPSQVRTIARGVAAGGIATDAAGRVYFTANNRIYRVSSGFEAAPDGRTAADSVPELVAGSGERGSLGDGGPAILAQLDLLIATSSGGTAANGNLSTDAFGNLFLADTLNHTVRRVDAESQLISSVAGQWATGTAEVATSRDPLRPALVALDVSGSVYIAGNSGLSRLDPSGAFTHIANVTNPVALAVSREGEFIAISVRGGEMIVVFERSDPEQYRPAFTWPATLETGIGSTAAGTGPFISAENGSVPNPRSDSFSGLAFDAVGNIYAAEKNANVVERLDFKTFGHVTIAGRGRVGYSGDGGPPLAAEFNAPGALVIDRDGNLFVADIGNLAIREVTHAATQGVTLTPNTFTFPNEPIGGSSVPEAFTLTNNSSAQVTGISIDFAGGSTPTDFTQSSTCATTLDASSSCMISVVFSPQAAGNRSAALHVADSDPSSPQTAALAGFADDYELALQSGNTDTLTIVQGSTANYNLAVVPDNTFSGTVTIQCPVGLPLDVACGLAAGTASNSSSGASGSSGPTTLPLNVTPGMPQNFTIALTTMAKNQAMVVAPVTQSPKLLAACLAILVFAVMANAFIAWRGRNRGSERRVGLDARSYTRLKPIGWALASVALMFLLVGCGSGSAPTLVTKPNPGTPAGTYHFDIIGSSQGASRGFTITLIVQTP